MPSAWKNSALGLALARFVWASAVLTLAILTGASAAPPPLKFIWDYSETNAPAAFTLLWGTNRYFASTNLTGAVSNVPAGLQTFRVVATNTAGAATSGPVQLRLVRVTIESAPSPLGPWLAKTNFYEPLPGTNQFIRSRVDLQ